MATGQEQASDYEKTPKGWAQRWSVELQFARKEMKDVYRYGSAAVRRFLDMRTSGDVAKRRLNLYTANEQLIRSLMYGNTPKVTVSRKFADAGDDIARVSAEMQDRLLNTDIDRDEDSYEEALGLTLMDYRVPGLGVARVRYECEWGEAEDVPEMLNKQTGAVAAEGYTQSPQKLSEDAPIDYVHWRDFLYSPARTWGQVTWVAFGADMSHDSVAERFDTEELVEARSGRTVADAIPYTAKRRMADEEKDDKPGPWARARVWEIWDKETKKVFWVVEGFSEVLDMQDDTLGLDSFFPCAKPLVMNVTTDAFLPRSQYVIAKDQYNRIDDIETRLGLLIDAVKLRGLYDKKAGEVKRLLEEGDSNELIPVDNWAMFAEAGGIRGKIDWLPLDMVAQAIAQLREEKQSLIQDLWQIEGLSDIMRGQAMAGSDATATERGIQARYGSVRIQAMQDEFARFASDLQRLRREVIAKFFDPKTIFERSNAQFLPKEDQQFIQPAIQLMKDRYADYRIEVKPESVSLTDFAALKAERMEVLAGMASFFQAIAPLLQMMPGSQPFFLELAQWSLAGIKGASVAEGIFDQAVASAEQAAMQPKAPPQPDPKVMAAQIKANADMAKVQADLQADVVRTKVEVEADAQREQNQALWNTREAAQKALIQHSLRPQPPLPGPFGNGVLP